jgi:hypothetical protein
MRTEYIYLLQLREFVNTTEPIYKVGMTKKENHVRFNQYPKGSILLFQMICDDCKTIEKKIITLFKQNFKLQTNIGHEYFEGKYERMIDIIYSVIKNEKSECEPNKEENGNDKSEKEENDNEETDNDKPTYEITTYEEWIKFNGLHQIVITNKKGIGFVRFKNQLWRKIYDKNRLDYDEYNMENLSDYIEKNNEDSLYLYKNYRNILTNEVITWKNFINLDETEIENYKEIKDKYENGFLVNEKCFLVTLLYSRDKIFKDIVKICYVKRYESYILDYHDYVFSVKHSNHYSRSLSYVIFNSVTFTFIHDDELINNKILTDEHHGARSVFVKSVVNTNVVDDILNSLISRDIKREYKKLVYNLLVEQEEKEIIFYDNTKLLLTQWLKDLLYAISGHKFYVESSEYYENKSEFKKKIEKSKPRCVFISMYRLLNGKITPLFERQINDFRKLGFQNIIVCQKDKHMYNEMYNITNYRNYLHDNKELLMKCIKEENKGKNYELESWEHEIQYDDNIFNKPDLLLTNFLKWCCTK